VVPAGHNYILIYKIHQKALITWCDGHRLTVSKYEPENPKKLIRRASEIQHEIYSASDWLGASPENLWWIRTTSWKSGKEGCEALEPPVPLHPQMSCDLLTRNGRRSTKSRTSPLPSARDVPGGKSLACAFKLSKLDLCMYPCAVISNSLNLLNLATSFGPTQSAKPVLNIWLCASIRLPHSLYHIRKHRDDLQYYLDQCTLIQRTRACAQGYHACWERLGNGGIMKYVSIHSFSASQIFPPLTRDRPPLPCMVSSTGTPFASRQPSSR